MTPVLSVKNLSIGLRLNTGQDVWAVDDVSFSIQKGESLALVGESGCGKSMTALGIARLLPNSAFVHTASDIRLHDIPLLDIPERHMREQRQKQIGMIFQDPMLALNPVLSIGQQLGEVCAHPDAIPATELLQKMRIPDPDRMLKAYPHELSGGMKQRIMIAMAIAMRPPLLIADEPTTALDVTTQASILSLVKQLIADYDMSLLLITHDLGIVSEIADRIACMYAGTIIEQQPTVDFLKQPIHPYSQLLLRALPNGTPHRVPIAEIAGYLPGLTEREFEGCRFKDRCPKAYHLCDSVPDFVSTDPTAVRCHLFDPSDPSGISMDYDLMGPEEEPAVDEVPSETYFEAIDLQVHYPIRRGLLHRTVGHVKAVDGVTLSLHEDQTLALVGESGCGKSTFARALLRLEQPTGGELRFMGRDITTMSQRELYIGRRYFQMIFQDPFSAFNPRMNIGDILSEGMEAFSIGTDKAERLSRLEALLDQVGLAQSALHRYPHEFSGGQRQRIGIARALSVGPRVLLCDEPTSALDMPVQAKILNLLQSLQNEYGLSYLFITHDISVAEYMADTIAVMYLGKVVEYGSKKDVLQNPKHPYTQQLLAAAPDPRKQKRIAIQTLNDDVPSPANPPGGCAFHPRCPQAMPSCQAVSPRRQSLDDAQDVACHLYHAHD